MGVFRLGSQRIGIVSDMPVLDAFGQPTYDEFMAPVYEPEPLVEWVDGCALEVQTMAEQQGLTSTTTSEVAVVLMPVAGQQVPLVDEAGAPAGFKDFRAISSSVRLREHATGLEYAMRSDAVLQTTVRGRTDHVECLCERERG